jgi:hypothetical protein
MPRGLERVLEGKRPYWRDVMTEDFKPFTLGTLIQALQLLELKADTPVVVPDRKEYNTWYGPSMIYVLDERVLIS